MRVLSTLNWKSRLSPPVVGPQLLPLLRSLLSDDLLALLHLIFNHSLWPSTCSNSNLPSKQQQQQQQSPNFPSYLPPTSSYRYLVPLSHTSKHVLRGWRPLMSLFPPLYPSLRATSPILTKVSAFHIMVKQVDPFQFIAYDSIECSFSWNCLSFCLW